MGDWRAHLEQDPITGLFRLWLGRPAPGRNGEWEYASGFGPDGALEISTASEAEATAPFLQLPREALAAIREAIEEHAPPPPDACADLREALVVERARVDRILERTMTVIHHPEGQQP